MEDSLRLEPGTTAPTFSASDQTGTLRSSDEFAATKVVIFFYPAAFTPGCTTESCDFRDRHEFFTSKGYTILGFSPDEPEKLAKFKEEYDLPYDLISDPDHAIATAYGAYGLKKNYGREYTGIIRSTFVIDKDWQIEAAYYNVKATGHAERIAQAVPEK